MEPGWRSPPQGALSPEKGEEGRRACGTEQPEADKDPSESTHTILAFTSSRSQSEDGLLTNDVLAYELPPRLCGSAGKESTCNAGDLGLIPGLGRSPEGKGYPIQYSGFENSMEHTVHGVTKSWTQLSDFHSSVFRQAQGLPSGFETWQCFRDAMILAALGTPGLPDQTGPD